MSNLSWYFRQLLPLKYEATYTEGGNRYRERWRMWFGRCFARRRVRIPTEAEMREAIFDLFMLHPRHAGKITGLTP